MSSLPPWDVVTLFWVSDYNSAFQANRLTGVLAMTGMWCGELHANLDRQLDLPFLCPCELQSSAMFHSSVMAGPMS